MPRTWDRVEVPGPEVTALQDSRSVLWTRDAPDTDIWWGDLGHGYDVDRTFAQLLRRGPLTDASGEG